MNTEKRQKQNEEENLNCFYTNKNVLSLKERNRRLNQYDNQIFREHFLCQSNCFITSGFDDNAFNDFANNSMNKQRNRNKLK